MKWERPQCLIELQRLNTILAPAFDSRQKRHLLMQLWITVNRSGHEIVFYRNYRAFQKHCGDSALEQLCGLLALRIYHVKCLCYTCRMYLIQYFESAELKLLLWKKLSLFYIFISSKNYVILFCYLTISFFSVSFFPFLFLVISFPEYLLYLRSETKLLSFTGKFQTFLLFHIWQAWVLFHCFRSIQGEQKCVHNRLSSIL